MNSDGIKRFDGKPINGHLHWWKISDFTTADIYNKGSGLRIDVVTKSAVPDKEFGKYAIDPSNNWGEPIVEVTKVRRSRPGGPISEYHVEQYGWISKQEAVELAAKGIIDNATPVFPKRGSPYLRSSPDQTSENNLGGMVV